jgi:hypothetical protein
VRDAIRANNTSNNEFKEMIHTSGHVKNRATDAKFMRELNAALARI